MDQKDFKNLTWEKTTESNFTQLISKIPGPMQQIAQEKITQRIEINLRKENRTTITEKDLVDAFFKETPFGFHGPMKTDMESVGIDYKKYGYVDNPLWTMFQNPPKET